MLRILLSNGISGELIATAVAIDHAVYAPEDWITRDRAEDIYRTAGDSLILPMDGERLMGLLSVFRISPALAARAVEIDYPIYKLLKPEHIITDNTAPADVYLHSIALLPQYRGKGYRDLLYLGMRQWCLSHTNSQFVWADAVSDEGRRGLTPLGLKCVSPSGGIFRGDYPTLQTALESKVYPSWSGEVEFLPLDGKPLTI